MTHIDIPTSSGLMTAWHRKPAEGVRPKMPLILLHEGFGLNRHIESIGERLVARGHPVIAPNLFWRQTREAAAYSDVPRALSLCANADVEQLSADIEAAAAIVSPNGGHVATLGFCFGGAVSYIAAARSPAVARSVAYYPVSILNYWDRIGPPRAPLLVFFGTDDEFLGPKEKEWLNGLHETPDMPIDVKIYAGAGHAFFNDARPDLYGAAAAVDSWERTLAFLDMK